jgi:hypothetical protein
MRILASGLASRNGNGSTEGDVNGIFLRGSSSVLLGNRHVPQSRVRVKSHGRMESTFMNESTESFLCERGGLRVKRCVVTSNSDRLRL